MMTDIPTPLDLDLDKLSVPDAAQGILSVRIDRTEGA
jgi:hypothetical protein